MKTRIKIFAALLNLVLTTVIYSQALFVDNFVYPACDSLEGFGGWYRSGGDSPYNIKVTSPGLVYAGYASSGISNCISIPMHDDGDICLHSLDQVSSGSIYMSFMLKIDSLSASSTSGCPISFDEFGGATNMNSKVFIKRLSSSTFNIGISKISSVKYSPVIYNTNTTYLIVTKYTFNAGLNDDTVKVYTFSNGVPATEPASAAAITGDDYDVNNIGEVAITNTYAAAGLQGSLIKIDGIRIGTTWNNVLFSVPDFHLHLTAFMEGFYNPVLQKMIKDTAKVIIRYNYSPYMAIDSAKSLLDSAGNGNFLFHQIQNYQYYFLIFKHRNSIETWTSGSKEFTLNNLNYDFTLSYSNAYGNNVRQVGQKYCIYGGDVNQDGTVDLTDIVMIFNDAGQFKTGYVITDLTGDNFADLSDLTLAANNSHNFISKLTP